MNATLFRLAPCAAVDERSPACAPDPWLLVRAKDEVRAWLEEGPWPTLVLSTAALEGEPYALVVTPDGPAWVPAAALAQVDEGGPAHLIAPVDVFGSRVELIWQPASPSADVEALWWRAGLDGDTLLFRRWDPVAGAASGPLRRASALAVVEAWEQAEPWGGAGEACGEARPLLLAEADTPSSEALIAAFLRHEGAGDGPRALAASSVFDALSRSQGNVLGAGEGAPAGEGAAAAEPRSAPPVARPQGVAGVPVPSAVKPTASAPVVEAAEPLRVRSPEAHRASAEGQGTASRPASVPAVPAVPSVPAVPASMPAVRHSGASSPSGHRWGLEAPALAKGAGGTAGEAERGGSTNEAHEQRRSPAVEGAALRRWVGGEALPSPGRGPDAARPCAVPTGGLPAATALPAPRAASLGASAGPQATPGVASAGGPPISTATAPSGRQAAALAAGEGLPRGGSPDASAPPSAAPAIRRGEVGLPAQPRAFEPDALGTSRTSAPEGRGQGPSFDKGAPAERRRLSPEPAPNAKVDATPAQGRGGPATPRLEASPTLGARAVAGGAPIGSAPVARPAAGPAKPSPAVAAPSPAEPSPAAAREQRGAAQGQGTGPAWSLRDERASSAVARPSPGPVAAPEASLPGRRDEGRGAAATEREGRPFSRLGAASMFVLGPAARPAVARSIEIGEIVVEIAADAPAWQPRPEPPVGSLIAAIPALRSGGGRR